MECSGGLVVKDLALSLLRCGFDHWSRNAHMPWAQQKKKKKKQILKQDEAPHHHHLPTRNFVGTCPRKLSRLCSYKGWGGGG